tara:strand:- start:111 stop:1304 length:1194 start_codon:yes stop_codon:yes gene_type:complete
MIKLKNLLKENWWDDLSDKAQAAYIEKHGEAPNVAGDDEDEKGKKKKYKQGAKKLTDPKTAKFGAKSSALQGPETAKDAVGTNQKEEQVIAKGMQKLGALAKAHRDKQEAYKNGEIDEDPGDFKVPEEHERYENLCTVSVPGTNLYCDDNKGISRDKMPQLKGKPVVGGGADPHKMKDKDGKIIEKPKCKEDEEKPQNCTGTKLDKNGNPTVTYDKDGNEFPITVDAATGEIEVDTEKAFEKWVKGRTNAKGESVSVSEEEIEDVSEMKATQNNIDGGKVAGMVSFLSNAPAEATEGFRGGSIFVSTEVDEKGKPLPSYILDGHHRWAAMTTMDIANGGSGNVQMRVRRINMTSVELVDATNEFTSQFIQPKSAPARTGHELDSKPKFAELYYRMKK